MAGFLDKQDRIIDVTLTDEGKRQRASGALTIAFFSVFDDAVDYDPFISGSGSLSSSSLESEITQQIESCLVLEAIPGPAESQKKPLGPYRGAVHRPLFTMPQGQRVISRVRFSPDVTSGSIEVVQRKIEEFVVRRDPSGSVVQRVGPNELGYERVRSAEFSLVTAVDDFFDRSRHAGIEIEVHRSSSDGVVRLDPKEDFAGHRAYGVELKIGRP